MVGLVHTISSKCAPCVNWHAQSRGPHGPGPAPCFWGNVGLFLDISRQRLMAAILVVPLEEKEVSLLVLLLSSLVLLLSKQTRNKRARMEAWEGRGTRESRPGKANGSSQTPLGPGHWPPLAHFSEQSLSTLHLSAKEETKRGCGGHAHPSSLSINQSINQTVDLGASTLLAWDPWEDWRGPFLPP